MYKSRINIFIIGIASAYLILFFVQISSPNLLPNNIYLTVAWVSLSLSITELIKNLLLSFNVNSNNFKEFLNKTYNIFSKLEVLEEDEKSKEFINKEKNEFTLNANNKTLKHNKTLKMFGDLFVNLGYIMSMIILIMTPLKKIPNTIEITKDISVITLITFVIMFVSIAINDYFNNWLNEIEDKKNIMT